MFQRYARALWLVLALLFPCGIVSADAGAPTVIPAHQFLAKNAVVMRDIRAQGGKAAVFLFPRADHVMHDFMHGATPALPSGDYLVTAWLEFVPVSTQNVATANITAGTASRRVTSAHFDANGYTPITFHLLHTGGRIPFDIRASTDNLMNAMRPGQSEEEKTYTAAKPKIKDIDNRKPDNDLEKLDIEDTKDISTLKFDDVRIACSKIEFKPVRLSNALVTRVEVDKVHYLPGETVNAACTVQGSAQGPVKLVAQLINEADNTRTVFEHDIQLDDKPQTIPFSVKLDDTTEFGHELRCSLVSGSQTLHSNNQVFGVSKNVYRVGITGFAGPQDRSHLTPEDAEKYARDNQAQYANYFECFAWAPCDYCNMTPKTDDFFSGQTQYHGSVHGFQNMISAAHKHGIKAISYAKEAACAIDGANMYLRHPDWFGGGAPPEFDTFYLERMHYNEFIMDAGDGQKVKWQHWANWWVNDAVPAAIDYGCDEIVRSAKLLGWDGIRWDGHYVDHMEYFNKRLLKQIPNFILGYNVAFANPGTPTFLPTLPASDFHQIAKNHGMIMDESIREWSMGAGDIRPYYIAICREADYEKRIGGLPLFIEFDRATHQDKIYNVLWGLAGGQRYTYSNTVGEFNVGGLTRFLTRYSAFIWDDTARIKHPEKTVSVTVSADQIPTPPVAAPKRGRKAAAEPEAIPPGPWFDQSTWLRKLPDGRQQLLVNIVNPPGYTAFCNRVQVPPPTLHDIGVKVQLPAGAKLLRTFSVSVDDVDGLRMLNAKVEGSAASVVIPQLRFWAIAVFEMGPSGAAPLAYPAYALTTPVEDAAKVLADQEKQKAIEAEQAAKAQASGVAIKPAEAQPWFRDFKKTYNVDLDYEKKLTKPASLTVMRNGQLDVLHVKGLYAWMNPVEDAIGLAGGGNLRAAYCNHAGFRLGPEGCLENFPQNYREMLNQDVVILDNCLARDIGARHRVMIADFVRNGGGLIVLSGCDSVSCGTDHNSYIGDMLPVNITGRRNTVCNDKGLNFAVEKNDIFSPAIDWSKINAYTVDVSPLKEGVQIIAKLGDKPAIVTSTYGKGRVICFLINMEGDWHEPSKPYWLSAQWPQILADAIKWAAVDHKSITKAVPVKHVVDPNKTVAMDLLLNAEGMNPTVFSKKLLEARDNVEDSASASALIQAATENWGKLTDKEMLIDIVNSMEPYIDESFAPLAEKITALSLDEFRVAGFTLLRHCSSPNSRPLLEKGLRESNPLIVREALAALAHAKDPASIPAIREYLAKGGKEHLLAYTALRLMGAEVDFDAALREYVVAFNRTTALTALRKSLFERLHGGTSFKLTLGERKNYERQYARSQITEKDAIFDVTQFRSTLTKFTDAQAEEFTKFVAGNEDRAAASMAFAALPNFTPEQAIKFRHAMAKAKLAQLQMLAMN